MVKVTNEGGARRGFYAGGDLHWLEPGASDEFDLTESEAEFIGRHGVLTVDGKGRADGGAPDLSILDGNVNDLKATLDGLDLDHLNALRAAEAEGKARAGALTAIDEAIAAKSA